MKNLVDINKQSYKHVTSESISLIIRPKWIKELVQYKNKKRRIYCAQMLSESILEHSIAIAILPSIHLNPCILIIFYLFISSKVGSWNLLDPLVFLPFKNTLVRNRFSKRLFFFLLLNNIILLEKVFVLVMNKLTNCFCKVKWFSCV